MWYHHLYIEDFTTFIRDSLRGVWKYREIYNVSAPVMFHHFELKTNAH